MPKITLRSTKGWNNRNRNLGIYLDGQKIGMIQSGHTKEFEIEPGEHELKAKSGLIRTKKTSMSLDKDENKNIELSGFKFWKWLASSILLIGVLFVIIGPYFNFYNDKLFVIFVILPEVVFLFYYLSFRFKLEFQ